MFILQIYWYFFFTYEKTNNYQLRNTSNIVYGNPKPLQLIYYMLIIVKIKITYSTPSCMARFQEIRIVYKNVCWICDNLMTIENKEFCKIKKEIKCSVIYYTVKINEVI